MIRPIALNVHEARARRKDILAATQRAERARGRAAIAQSAAACF